MLYVNVVLAGIYQSTFDLIVGISAYILLTPEELPVEKPDTSNVVVPSDKYAESD